MTSAGETAGYAPVQFWPHYKICKIESMADIKAFFPAGEADQLNWLFLSTSGIHGHYGTLDEWGDAKREMEAEGDEGDPTITVLIVQPRLVVMHYGNIPVAKGDIPYLRKLVASTLKAVRSSQTGNLPEEADPQ